MDKRERTGNHDLSLHGESIGLGESFRIHPRHRDSNPQGNVGPKGQGVMGMELAGDKAKAGVRRKAKGEADSVESNILANHP